MRSFTSVLALLFVLVVCSRMAPAAEPAPLQGDLKEIQGEWHLVSAENRGRSAPDSLIKSARLIFKGTEMQILRPQNPDQEEEHLVATFKLDSSTDPKHIDVVPQDGPQKGKTLFSIYQLKDGKLTICGPNSATEESGRPANFQPKADADLTVLVMERTKDK
jgi:uncharacterized protein (TIGR03067 family)